MGVWTCGPEESRPRGGSETRNPSHPFRLVPLRFPNSPTPQFSVAPILLVLLLVLIGLAPSPAHAQVPDSARADTTVADTTVADTTVADTTVADTTQAAPPDSMRQQQGAQAQPDTLTAPLPFLRLLRGRPTLDVPPIQHAEADLAHLLTSVPGTFLFDLGANGWPDGWSWNGFNPQRPSLVFDGHPYNDPVTGRPRFDLLPPEFLYAPHVDADRLGGPVAVYAQPRSYDVKRPLTELHYRRDNTSVQSIAAVHAQQRYITPRGRPSLLQIVGGYYGRAGDNEYPNSDLRRERRLLGRLHLRGEEWSATLRNLHSRRKIGAHGGVQPQGTFFETIYNRPIANVRLNDARRQTIRNDLGLTVRAPLVPGADAPAVLSANWTAQTFRYYDPDTLLAKTNRFSGYLRQEFTLGPQTLRAEVAATLDRLRTTNAWSGHAMRQRLHATLRDSIGWGATSAVLNGGLHVSDAQQYPSASVHVNHQWGWLRAFANGQLAGQPVSWIETAGFGDTVVPLDTVPTGRILYARAGLDADLGAFDVRLTGFAHTTHRPIDLYATATPDVLTVQASDAPFRRAGATLAVGWRRDAPAGLYASAQGTGLQFLNAGAGTAHARVAETLPQVFGHGRLGARFVAFEGDLDADLYVQGRGWTAMRSRQFHPPTGLLAVPPADAPVIENAPRSFGPSGTLDVALEAGIRDATLFLTFENVLSGTSLQPGVLVVPVYPLPEQRFRFGVFWPIWE